MKPLATSQRVLTWLCLLKSKENPREWEKRSYVILVFALILGALILFLPSLIFVVKYKSINMEDTSNALCTAIGAVPMANSIIVSFFIRHKIPPLFEKLSNIYGKYKDGNSFRFLVRANEQSEWVWEMYFKFIIRGGMVMFLTSSIASVLICWLWNGNFDSTLVFRPYRFVLPWDQTTLLGYFGEMICSILSAETFLLYNGAVLVIFVSICLHHQAFYSIFCHKLCKLDCPDEDRNDKEFLREIIDFHTTIKDWFSDTAGVYSLHLMAHLICNMLMLAIFTFQLDQQIFNQFDIGAFVFSLFVVNIYISNIFLCCFLGKIASGSYQQMANALYECNWCELPFNLQKYLIIMVANAQIPLIYSGYGIITLNLETFSKLMRAVFTYYMLFKTLNE